MVHMSSIGCAGSACDSGGAHGFYAQNLGDLCAESGQTLPGSFSAVSKPNFVRTSEVRKMKEKMRKCYVTEKMESQQKKVSLQS